MVGHPQQQELEAATPIVPTVRKQRVSDGCWYLAVFLYFQGPLLRECCYL